MKISRRENGKTMGNILIGIMIPFVGTTAGAGCVYFLKNGIRKNTQKMLLGFASGVMTAASVWSLLIPAMDLSASMGKLAFFPAAVGFLLGIAFLLLLDRTVPHLHMDCEEPEGPACALRKTTMLILAVTLHNIPEGIAVFVTIFAGTGSRKKAFIYSFLSGLSEPIGGLVGYLFLRPLIDDLFFGIILAGIAGIMIFISIDELLPSAEEYGEHHLSIYALVAGMMLMAAILVILP